MPKQIKTTETYIPPEAESGREIVVVQTEDETRYIFDVNHDSETVLFSHRYYPQKECGERHDPSNYRLPRKVEEYVRKRYGHCNFMDGMMKEAQRNATASVSFNNEQNTQSA